MWILEGTIPDADQVTFRLAAGAVKTIGRSSGAEFFVDAALVSRLHCQLTGRIDRVEVKDLDSTNGTFVNGQRIETAVLKHGDTLSIGRVELTIKKSD